jgi:ArsR family transcriptional regulator
MRIRKDTPDSDNIIQLAKTSDAIAHPARISMLRFILDCNASRVPVRNKNLVAAFPYSQATISQHISKLVIGGLLETRQEGTSTLYYANIGMLSRYVDLLRNFNS